MALDFPASPSVNQTYSGPGGVVWVWDGAKWTSGTGSTVYAPVTSPVFQGNPQAPNPPAGDADTSVATTSFVAAAVAPAFNDRGRNLIHNPLFNVAQRGAGPWTVGGYTLDRWFFLLSLDAATLAQTAIVDGARAQIGDEEAAFAFDATVTGNVGAGSYSALSQFIERVRRLAGKTVTVSFWAAASSGTPKLGISIDQSFGTGGSPSAAVNGNGTAVTISTTWTRYSVTIAIPSVSGKTLGTNGNDWSGLNIWLSAGSTFAARSGSIGVQTAHVFLWGVQLETGSVATPLEKPDPRYDLANCQRFYQVSLSLLLEAASTASYANGVQINIPPMRAAPTLTVGTNASTNASSVSLTAASSATLQLTCNAVASGQLILWVYGCTASADL